MPLPLTVSCCSKIQIGFTFLVPAHLGSLGKRAVKRVCVCVWLFTCSDIDECAADNGGCSVFADCSNNAGSFSCSCRNGFTGDGMNCTGKLTIKFIRHNGSTSTIYTDTHTRTRSTVLFPGLPGWAGTRQGRGDGPKTSTSWASEAARAKAKWTVPHCGSVLPICLSLRPVGPIHIIIETVLIIIILTKPRAALR